MKREANAEPDSGQLSDGDSLAELALVSGPRRGYLSIARPHNGQSLIFAR